MAKRFEFALRYVVGMCALLACIFGMQEATRQTPAEHERAMEASESCGSARQRHLTVAQSFPLLPSEREWLRVVRAASMEDRYRFDPELPMCRYDEETGCWIPMVYQWRPCTQRDRDELRKAR